MIDKIYKELFIVVLIFLVGWAGFTFLKLKVDAPSIQVSIEDEEKLGEILTESVFSEMEEVHSPYLDSVIFEITKRLESGIETTPYDYTFHVIKSNEINAFATLGGHIFIYTELIQVTESPEELAAVLAHEMGHVEKRHVVDRMVTEVGLTILFSAISGSDPMVISELLNLTISNVFSRSQEKEADQFALQLMENCTINPVSLAHSFRKLKEHSSSSMIPEVLSTHPNINARIQASLRYKVADDFTATPFDFDWNRVKAELATPAE